MFFFDFSHLRVHLFYGCYCSIKLLINEIKCVLIILPKRPCSTLNAFTEVVLSKRVFATYFSIAKPCMFSSNRTHHHPRRGTLIWSISVCVPRLLPQHPWHISFESMFKCFKIQTSIPRWNVLRSW